MTSPGTPERAVAAASSSRFAAMNARARDRRSSSRNFE